MPWAVPQQLLILMATNSRFFTQSPRMRGSWHWVYHIGGDRSHLEVLVRSGIQSFWMLCQDAPGAAEGIDAWGQSMKRHKKKASLPTDLGRLQTFKTLDVWMGQSLAWTSIRDYQLFLHQSMSFWMVLTHTYMSHVHHWNGWTFPLR